MEIYGINITAILPGVTIFNAIISTYLALFILSYPMDYRVALREINRAERVYGKFYESCYASRISRAQLITRLVVPLLVFAVVNLVGFNSTYKLLPNVPAVWAMGGLLGIATLIVAVDLKNRFVVPSMAFINSYKSPTAEDYMFHDSGFDKLEIDCRLVHFGETGLRSFERQYEYLYLFVLETAGKVSEQLAVIVGCNDPLPGQNKSPFNGKLCPMNVFRFDKVRRHMTSPDIGVLREWEYADLKQLHYLVEDRIYNHPLLANNGGKLLDKVFIRRVSGSLQVMTPERLQILLDCHDDIVNNTSAEIVSLFARERSN